MGAALDSPRNGCLKMQQPFAIKEVASFWRHFLAKKTYIQLGEELAAYDRQGSFFAFAEKLGVTRTAAYRLIHSAEVARQIEKAGLPVPPRESQARILHEQLSDPDQRITVWKAAIEAGSVRVTAASVKATVAAFLKEQKERAFAELEMEKAKKKAEYDSLDIIGRLEIQMATLIARENDDGVRAKKQAAWSETKQKIVDGEMKREDVADHLRMVERLASGQLSFGLGIKPRK